ncbi:MAG: hypothetical protein JXA36_06290 [Coriobacteriia bacterium]|nr:hypothetical protein [Coriobacteriia bacterium]
MYGWFNLGNNVSGIMFNLTVVVFFVVVAIGIGFLVYAAKQLKKAEDVLRKSKPE